MQVLFFVINRPDKVDELLERFNEAGLKGATVINSTGMAHTLANHHEDDLTFASLRAFFVGNREDNRTIFMVADDKSVEIARKIFHEVIDVTQPDSGIVFGMPVTFVDGISSLAD